MIEKSKATLIVLGIASGIALSLVPEPLLHALIYRDALSTVTTLAILGGVAILISFFAETHLFGLTRRQAYRMFSIGISGISFVLALYTFYRYPEILASNDYMWAVQSNWNIGGITNSVGALIFFNASVLWETLMGSLFGVLENSLRLA